MKTKKMKSVVFCVFILLVSTLGVNSQVPEAVIRAAENGLPKYLDLLPEGSESDFGFKSRPQLQATWLGQPYRMVTIHPRDLLSTENPDNINVIPLDIWRFPVMCDGHIRALLTVALMNVQWEAVELGAAEMAAELDELENIFVPDPGSNRKMILRLFQIKSDFVSYGFLSEPVTESQFMPLRSAKMALGTMETEFLHYRLMELLPLVRTTFRKELQDAIYEQGKGEKR